MLTENRREQEEPLLPDGYVLCAPSGKTGRGFAEGSTAATLGFSTLELEDELHGGHFMPPHVELGVVISPEAPDWWLGRTPSTLTLRSRRAGVSDEDEGGRWKKVGRPSPESPL